ncbi:TraB/GumN family protein [Pinibacter soli]|uniref:TraB/GumN family protein n=1 Tax=Pinibacter soli TaxID=3044211 RepID=A0ABT6RCX2_9BACT|nr:TraB/GumN family protein [Pinibacter soli]MDI3320405.1 TraB/GumN family protein [Pinibacter soli]
MKKLTAFILFCAIALGLYAQKTTNKSAVAKSEPLANSLLWKISGHGLSHPSYLFGTMHILCSDDAQLSDSLEYVIRTTDKVYFEIDMDNMMEMMGALRYIRMNGNQKLADLLSEGDYKKVKDYFTKNPSMIPFSMMEKFKPYFIASLLSEQKMDCPQKDGMEQVIMTYAKKNGKEIKGLETAAYQASIFDSIPYKMQADQLVKMIDSIDVKSNDDTDLEDVYRSQDLSKIQEMVMKEDDINQSLDLLLYNRNKNWAIKINDIIQSTPCLFAVGAAHLPGDLGVINLLKKQGYVLTPVKHAPANKNTQVAIAHR